MLNTIQGLSEPHIDTMLTYIHKRSLSVEINVNSALFTPFLNAHSDCDVRKLIRLAGSVLCDGRQMALGRKRKRGYKGWLTAQIYVAVARRLRSSQQYMCDRLFTRPDPINAPTPTH